MWSTIILCNFQSCCYFRFRFGRCIVWGKISNYWFISFFGRKTFFTWNQVDPALWNRVFPEFFSDKKQNWNKLVGYHFLDEKHVLREIRLILLYEMGPFSEKTKLNQNGWLSWFGMKQNFNGIRVDLYQMIVFEEKCKTKTIGNSTPCTELRCWNAM